jgi:hypothetical protein
VTVQAPLGPLQVNFVSEQRPDTAHAVNASFWQLVAAFQPAGAEVAPVHLVPVHPVWPWLMHLRLAHSLSLVHQQVEFAANPVAATGLRTPPPPHVAVNWVQAVRALPVVRPGHVPVPVVHANFGSEHEKVVVPMHATVASAWQLVDGSGVPEPVHGPPVHWPALMHLRLAHWESAVQRQLVWVAESQTRPAGHAYVGAAAVHDVGRHCPTVAPAHA